MFSDFASFPTMALLWSCLMEMTPRMSQERSVASYAIFATDLFWWYLCLYDSACVCGNHLGDYLLRLFVQMISILTNRLLTRENIQMLSIHGGGQGEVAIAGDSSRAKKVSHRLSYVFRGQYA